jgi:hypothetical protein
MRVILEAKGKARGEEVRKVRSLSLEYFQGWKSKGGGCKRCFSWKHIKISDKESEKREHNLYWQIQELWWISHVWVSDERIDHSKRFANGRVYINGIEGFWGYAKERLLRFEV